MPDNPIEKKKLIGITSPPYENQIFAQDKEFYKKSRIDNKRNPNASHFKLQGKYSKTKENIGNLKTSKQETEESFDITRFHSCDDSLYWHGCYNSDAHFKQYIHPDTFAHPAKASMLLMDRIFKHLKQLGLLNKGDVITDFMAGSGRTGIMASLHGHDFIGIELEPHFIKMINDNKTLLERKIGRKVNWQVIQGDSRKLSETLQQNNLVGITSPPYQDSKIPKGDIDFLDVEQRKSRRKNNNWDGYSSNPLNIGNLKDGTLIGITSPPYSGISETSQESSINEIQKRIKKGIKGAVIREDGKAMTGSGKRLIKYSDSKNNIANLSDKNLVGITSPPYGHDSIMSPNQNNPLAKEKFHNTPYSEETIDFESRRNPKTGRFDAHKFQNIGRMKDSDKPEGQESYLQAMLQVYREAAKVLPVIVTVTKNPTRNGKLRRLDLDTVSLLQTAGYQIADYHRAILFEESKQATLTGDIKKELKGRLSFFKRISVQKGNLAAKWEDIIIGMRK